MISTSYTLPSHYILEYRVTFFLYMLFRYVDRPDKDSERIKISFIMPHDSNVTENFSTR